MLKSLGDVKVTQLFAPCFSYRFVLATAKIYLGFSSVLLSSSGKCGGDGRWSTVSLNLCIKLFGKPVFPLTKNENRRYCHYAFLYSWLQRRWQTLWRNNFWVGFRRLCYLNDYLAPPPPGLCAAWASQSFQFLARPKKKVKASHSLVVLKGVEVRSPQ